MESGKGNKQKLKGGNFGANTGICSYIPFLDAPEIRNDNE